MGETTTGYTTHEITGPAGPAGRMLGVGGVRVTRDADGEHIGRVIPGAGRWLATSLSLPTPVEVESRGAGVAELIRLVG